MNVYKVHKRSKLSVFFFQIIHLQFTPAKKKENKKKKEKILCSYRFSLDFFLFFSFFYISFNDNESLVLTFSYLDKSYVYPSLYRFFLHT